MICAGIDAGSRAIKIVLLENDGLEVVKSGVADQGVQQDELAAGLFEEVLKKSGLTRANVGSIVATGYGRNAVTFAGTTITEITCHSRGVRQSVPDAMTIIDIGGQDSKLMRLNEDGNVRDFAMNDRCAAGTGRFLEVVADRLAVDLASLGRMARRSKRPARISSTCVVFAETEIIGLLASGIKPEDIVAGVQNSLAARISAMAGRSLARPVVLTGGVAMVPGMAGVLESALGVPVSIAREPQMTGALGAALLACEQCRP